MCLAKRNETFALIPGKRRISAFAFTSIYSKKKQEIHALIGFEIPIRSNREYCGIPKRGLWDPNGGQIWLNDIPLGPPDWENAGKFNHYRVASWNWPNHEISFVNEEFFWTR